MAFIPMLDEITTREDVETTSLLDKIFTKEQIKMLFYHACRIDIEDNNEKAELIQEIIGPEFEELGTGTNRVAYRYTPDFNRKYKGGSGLVFEFALDRRGFVDNYTEFKRSAEQPELIVHVYETNMLISVQEYFYMIDENTFRLNEDIIKNEILKPLSEQYIFEDIGFNMKNYANFGYRSNDDLIIGDAGYLYPKKGQEKALTCPSCGGEMVYNASYTGFVCRNHMCDCKMSFMDIRRQMNTDLEDIEDQTIMELNDVEMPDFDRLNDTILGGKVGPLEVKKDAAGELIIPKLKMSQKSFMEPPQINPLPSTLNTDEFMPEPEEDGTIDSDKVIDMISEEDLAMIELMSYDNRIEKATEKMQRLMNLDEDEARIFAQSLVDLNDARISEVSNDDVNEQENTTLKEVPMNAIIDDIINDFKSGQMGDNPVTADEDESEKDVMELSDDELRKQIEELNRKMHHN